MKKISSLFTAMLILMAAAGSLTAQEYKNTIVTPFPDLKINNRDNIIYTSSFSSAWKMLERDVLGDVVKVKKKLMLVDRMNESEPVELNRKDCLNLSGFVKDGIVDKIKSELKSKFNKDIDPALYSNEQENIICYSYFNKNIRFKTKFEVYDQAFPFFCNEGQFDVKCFGIWSLNNSENHRKISRQVKIYDYKNIGDYILSINNSRSEDELILAAVAPGETLYKTVQTTLERIKHNEPENPAENDRLILPMVKIGINKKYQELYGVHLANKGFESYFFAEAMEDIQFELNESGAFADSESKIILKKGPGPRIMIINHPFLLMMKEKKSDQPYFAAWIANPELLLVSR